MKIYISGKITGIPMWKATENFLAAEVFLSEKYSTNNIVNPLAITPFLRVEKWIFFMISDIREQRKCTHSAFQKNWYKSKGSVIEYFIARFVLKQKIIFLK